MPDGHPDLSGYWQRPYTPDMSVNATDLSGKPFPLEDPMHRGVELKAEAAPQGRGGRGGRAAHLLPFTPKYLKNWQTYDPTNGDYTGACLPFGLVRSINSPDPLQIMQHGTYLAELFEQNTWFHVVYIDGRDHPKDLDPTWFGNSVGKWDGDTLVVDTIGFNGKTRLDTIGHPHTDQLHVIERFTLTDPQHINYEVTIDDPKAYTRPFTNKRIFTKMKKGEELIEYSCEENNRDLTQGHIK